MCRRKRQARFADPAGTGEGEQAHLGAAHQRHQLGAFVLASQQPGQRARQVVGGCQDGALDGAGWLCKEVAWQRRGCFLLQEVIGDTRRERVRGLAQVLGGEPG